jgi:hypothetical protein
MSIEQVIGDLPDGRLVVDHCGDCGGCSGDTNFTTADLKHLVRKLAAAREALEVYGNEENWQDIFDDGKWEFKPLGEEAGGYKLALSTLTALDEME